MEGDVGRRRTKGHHNSPRVSAVRECVTSGGAGPELLYSRLRENTLAVTCTGAPIYIPVNIWLRLRPCTLANNISAFAKSGSGN